MEKNLWTVALYPFWLIQAELCLLKQFQDTHLSFRAHKKIIM